LLSFADWSRAKKEARKRWIPNNSKGKGGGGQRGRIDKLERGREAQ